MQLSITFNSKECVKVSDIQDSFAGLHMETDTPSVVCSVFAKLWNVLLKLPFQLLSEMECTYM